LARNRLVGTYRSLGGWAEGSVDAVHVVADLPQPGLQSSHLSGIGATPAQYVVDVPGVPAPRLRQPLLGGQHPQGGGLTWLRNLGLPFARVSTASYICGRTTELTVRTMSPPAARKFSARWAGDLPGAAEVVADHDILEVQVAAQELADHGGRERGRKRAEPSPVS